MSRVSSGSAWIGLAVGLLFSGVALFLAVRNLDLSLVLHELASADPYYLAVALVVVGLANVFRALRWRVLLAHAPPPPLRVCFTSMMIGYLVNIVVPARLGELVRIYVLGYRTGIGKSRSAPSIIVERVIDGLLLLGLAALFVPLPEAIVGAGWIAAACFVAGGVGLLVLVLRGQALVARTARLVGLVSPRLAPRVAGMVEQFLEGLRSMWAGGQLFPVVGSTILIWATELVAIALVAWASNLTLSPSALLLVLVLVSLSFLIPAAPGGVGIYELAVIVALTPFAVDDHRALSFAVVLHGVTTISSLIQGVAALWLEGLSWRNIIASVRGPATLEVGAVGKLP